MTDSHGRATREPSSRRRLLEVLMGSGVAASLASFIYPILKFLLPPRTAEADSDTVVAKINELAPNSAKLFPFGERPAILIRKPDGSYVALTAVCTHLNCTVQYRAGEHDVWCACHNGVYSLQGHNVSGPPPRPLEEFEVHIQDNDIVVSRKSRT